MDPGVSRHMHWWGTAVLGLGLIFVGTFMYIMILEDLAWYRTDVVDNRDVRSMDIGDYVRVEGDVALNATEDVVISQRLVERTTWDYHEYDYQVAHVWVTDDRGDPILVLFDHVPHTKEGRHDGDYHRGDQVCIGGYVTQDASGIKRVRAHFVAKHQNDTHAIFWEYYVAAIVVGFVLLLAFVVARVFLTPRKREAPDWRGL